MAFSMRNMFSGALSGAGAGTAISPGWGTVIGAGIGAIGGAMMPDEPSIDQSAFQASPEEMAAYNEMRGIASGSIASPAEQQLKMQANRSFAQQVGMLGANRGASYGATSAHMQEAKANQDALLNEQAAQVRMQERQNALGNMMNFNNALAGRRMNLAAYNQKTDQANLNQQYNMLGNAAKLGAWGASQYGSKNLSDQGNVELGSATNPSYDPNKYTFGASLYNQKLGK